EDGNWRERANLRYGGETKRMRAVGAIVRMRDGGRRGQDKGYSGDGGRKPRPRAKRATDAASQAPSGNARFQQIRRTVIGHVEADAPAIVHGSPHFPGRCSSPMSNVSRVLPAS